MTIARALKESGLERIDAEVLLAHALKKNRSWLVAHDNEGIEQHFLYAFEDFVKRRKRGEPVAYIVGFQEFYGRKFFVTRNTLIPRPATEGIIEETLEFLKNSESEVRTVDTDIVVVSKRLSELKPTTIIDVGTGSGCIAITLACEGIAQRIIGIDISAGAIAVAKQNAKKLCPSKRIDFVTSDGIPFVKNYSEPFLLVSNPPYISDDVSLPKSVAEFEPKQALSAGEHGLAVLQPLIKSACGNPACVGFVIECRADQEKSLSWSAPAEGCG